jgi:hypothetical protein
MTALSRNVFPTSKRVSFMADPTLRSIARSLDVHIKDDHAVHAETNKRLDDIALKVAPLDSIRRWLFRAVGLVMSGIAVSLAVQYLQNQNLHQQTATAAAQAVNQAESQPTPTEKAILQKLDALQSNQ